MANIVFRRTSTDLNAQQTLNEFRTALGEAANNLDDLLSSLGQLQFRREDEDIKLYNTVPTPLTKVALEPIEIFSAPEGGGTKFKKEADKAGIEAGSSVSYFFDEYAPIEDAVPSVSQLPTLIMDSVDQESFFDGSVNNVTGFGSLIEETKLLVLTQPVLSPADIGRSITISGAINPVNNRTSIILAVLSPVSALLDDGGTPFIRETSLFSWIMEETDVFQTAGAHVFTPADLGKTIKIVNATTSSNNTEAVITAIVSPLMVHTNKTFTGTHDLLRSWNLVYVNYFTSIPSPEVVQDLTKIKDHSGGNIDATFIGLPALPSVIEGPFGESNGRVFVPGVSAYVQVETIIEGANLIPQFPNQPDAFFLGTPNAEVLRQTEEMGISAVVRPMNTVTSSVICSLSSVPIASPSTSTLYSLSLTARNGFLFPRLTWQYFDEIALAVRTVYAQSVIPLPLPSNPLSDPPTLPSTPGSSYFIGAYRYYQDTPFMVPPFPLNGQPIFPFSNQTQVMLKPNSSNLKPFNGFPGPIPIPGDFFVLGNDKRSYQSTYFDGALLMFFPPYMGPPPQILPLPKGKNIRSMGVCFYLGDMNNGNFIVDHNPLYGTGPGPTVPFIPAIHQHLPAPGGGEAGNFFIGSDPCAASYLTGSGIIDAALTAAGAAVLLPDATGIAVTAAAHAAAAAAASLLLYAHQAAGFFEPAFSFTGDMYMLSHHFSVPKTQDEKDTVMEGKFNQCFPDYTITGNLVARSGRSKIPDNIVEENTEPVYVNFSYFGDPEAVQDTSEDLKTKINELLETGSNPATTDLDSLGEAIGVNTDDSQNSLEDSLSPYGLHVVDGEPYYTGDENVADVGTLINTIGYDDTKIILDGPIGPVLVTSIEETTEKLGFDICGNSAITLVVTETILGIDISVQRAMQIAGVTDEGLTIKKLFWIGGIQQTSPEIQAKLASFGLEPEDKAAALQGVSTENILVFVIDNKNIINDLNGTDAQKKKLFTERKVTGLDLAPSLAKKESIVNSIIQAPPYPTSDGAPNPVTPLFALMRTVDLGQVYGIAIQDGEAVLADVEAYVKETGNDICQTLFEGNRSAIENTQNGITSFLRAIAPITTRLNINISMSELVLNQYIPCIGEVTATAAIINVDILLPNPPNILLPPPLPYPPPAPPFPPPAPPPPPTPTFPPIPPPPPPPPPPPTFPPPPVPFPPPPPPPPPNPAALLQRLQALKSPLDILQDELHVLQGAIITVATQAEKLLCISQNYINAMIGGVCGIEVPIQADESSCVAAVPSFNDYVNNQKAYLNSVRAMLFNLLLSLTKLSLSIDRSTGINSNIQDNVDECISKVAALMVNLFPPAEDTPLNP